MPRAKWIVPIPTDKAFIKLVNSEIAIANERADQTWSDYMETAGGKEKQALARRQHGAKQKGQIARKYIRKPMYPAQQPPNKAGRCKGCGCNYDSYTKNCDPCKSRHYHRRKKAGH